MNVNTANNTKINNTDTETSSYNFGEKKIPALSARLNKIAEMVPHCRCFADIGTDHGYLPVYLCNKGIAEHAIACDINQGPLNRASDTISHYRVSDKIQLRLGNGLDPIGEGEADAIVIAGMGGLLIADILNSSPCKCTEAKSIILQPMSAVAELREYLITHGWDIVKEDLAEEKDKIYNILSVLPAENRIEKIKSKPTVVDMYIGRYLIDNKPNGFDTYINKVYTKTEKMLNGLKNSQTAESVQKTREALELKQVIEKIINGS